jgi:hypothetical protein
MKNLPGDQLPHVLWRCLLSHLKKKEKRKRKKVTNDYFVDEFSAMIGEDFGHNRLRS